jgi:hypothetical protein
MKAVAVIVLAFSSMCFGAGWNAAIWPAWEHQAKTDLIESNLVEQVKARQYVRGGYRSNQYAAVSWWRSRSGNLGTLKTRTKSLFTYNGWVNPTSDVLATLRNGDALPVFYETNICALLGEWRLPTNFLDYTPWRDISGVGGFTNDIAAVGHPHGVTNTSTARGGTNFPTGRTRWYTTDYGYDGMRAVLTNLARRTEGYIEHHGGTHYIGWGGGYESSWDDAKAEAQETYTSDGSSIAQQKTILALGWTNVARYAYGITSAGHMDKACTDVDTNWISTVSFLFLIDPPSLGTTNIFDGQATDFEEGYNAVEPFLYTVTNGLAEYRYVFAYTNFPPHWPAAPENADERVHFGWKLRGYGDTDKQYMIVDYDF